MLILMPACYPLIRRVAFALLLAAALSLAPDGSLPGTVVPSAHAQPLAEDGNLERQSVSEQMAVATTGDTVMVLLKGQNQSRVDGVVKDQDERQIEITLLEGGGVQTLDREVVFAVSQAGQTAEQQRAKGPLSHLRPDHTSGKLFFLPTARRNESGTGMVVNDLGLLLPYADFTLPGGGLTLRAGSSAFPLPWQYMHGGGKLVLVPLERFSVAIGALGGLSTNYLIGSEYSDEWAGAGWLETTIDLRARDNAAGQRVETTGVTLGAGYLKSGGIIGEGLVFMGGFEHRQGGNFKFLFEGEYLPQGRTLQGGIFPDDDGRASHQWIASTGVRYIGRITSVEVGALTGSPLIRSGIPAVPVVGFGLKVF